ncbi:MAG: hypothetical protein A3E00_09655 [Curvibacter sp. RIFCSPHIGHO2_12_FULL_63_18]|nr:MAG: hypothetical protein A3E00_09655 [Curvibacter sp. RIFCSPHIGHO2_12_FULL_63_18]
MNAPRKIAFRVDESSQVGFGHMSRCRTLAHALWLAGCEVQFYCAKISNSTRRELEVSGFHVFLLQTEQEFLDADLSESVVVVDGYQFGPELGGAMKKRAWKTVYLDDYRGVNYDCDVLICNNEGLMRSQLSTPEYCKVFLGGRYVLIKPEVLRAARCLRHGARISKSVMLVAGGTNQKAWVIRMLGLLGKLEPRAVIWVLTGRRLSAVNVQRASGLPLKKLRFFSKQSATQMIRRYQRAGYLVAPASTVLLEAFAAGIPAISGWIAQNQQTSLNAFEAQGLIANIGDLRVPELRELRAARSSVLKSGVKMARLQEAFIRESLAGTAEIVQELLGEC